MTAMTTVTAVSALAALAALAFAFAFVALGERDLDIGHA